MLAKRIKQIYNKSCTNHVPSTHMKLKIETHTDIKKPMHTHTHMHTRKHTQFPVLSTYHCKTESYKTTHMKKKKAPEEQHASDYQTFPVLR